MPKILLLSVKITKTHSAVLLVLYSFILAVGPSMKQPCEDVKRDHHKVKSCSEQSDKTRTGEKLKMGTIYTAVP